MPTYTSTAGAIGVGAHIPNSQTAWAVDGGTKTATAWVSIPVTPPTVAVTDYVNLENFGFSIPADEEILGVSVSYSIVGVGTGGHSGHDYSVVLMNAGGVSSDLAQPSTLYPHISPPTAQVRGDSGNLWGLALTPAIVNGSTFGFALACTINPVTGTVNFSLFSCSMTVTTQIVASPFVGSLLGGGRHRTPPLRF